MFLFMSSAELDFKTAQLKNERVKTAYKEKESVVNAWFATYKTSPSSCNLLIRAFKKEKIVELWACPKNRPHYLLVHTFKVCASSGTLGPKREQGDLQTPEGFYFIDRFNPLSNFYLSLGINYPNQADKKLGRANPGGDIFIHGDCVTVGCLPLTDEHIKSLYLACIEAKNAGQNQIPVEIYPFKMTETQFVEELENHPSHQKLWSQLKTIYLQFEQTKQLVKVKINADGSYQKA
jgi:murein L,D-transpeptidase YafK